MALLALFAASAAADSLVPNGNFDGGTYTGANGDIVANDWILDPMDDVSLSDFDIESTPGVGQGGNPDYAAFMSSSVPIPAADYGTPNTAADEDNFGQMDCFYTTLSTVIGQQYIVSFWVNIIGSIDNNQTSLDPVWNWAAGDNSAYMLPTGAQPNYLDPTTNQFTGWTQYTFTETATSTSTNLMFHGTDGGGAILLDNVVVTAQFVAPEPSSLLLISSGLVIVGLYRRRARKDC